MATELGKFLKKLRIQHGELLKDMAINLNVSSSFMSAVENGKKKIPQSWYVQLPKRYQLSKEDKHVGFQTIRFSDRGIQGK